MPTWTWRWSCFWAARAARRDATHAHCHSRERTRVGPVRSRGTLPPPCLFLGPVRNVRIVSPSPIFTCLYGSDQAEHVHSSEYDSAVWVYTTLSTCLLVVRNFARGRAPAGSLRKFQLLRLDVDRFIETRGFSPDRFLRETNSQLSMNHLSVDSRTFGLNRSWQLAKSKLVLKLDCNSQSLAFKRICPATLACRGSRRRVLIPLFSFLSLLFRYAVAF